MHKDLAEMRRMRDKGMTLPTIAKHFGMHPGAVGNILGHRDPLGLGACDPGPLRSERLYNETPEQRAFRRFPITCHKPA